MLVDAGYRPLEGDAAIIPIIVGETSEAIALSERLLDEGIFVTGFGYPVVPEGTAQIDESRFFHSHLRHPVLQP